MELLPCEVIENLGEGFQIIQDKTEFCYGTDAVALVNFMTAKPKEKVLDLCSGTGIIPILLCKQTRCDHVTALEIQQKMCNLFSRSVALNGLEDKIDVVCGDLKEIKTHFLSGAFDVVSCNPPYMVQGTGKKNESEGVKIARHEILCTLDDVVRAGAYAVKSGGRFYMVHRAERLADVVCTFRKYRIEPKKLTFVSATSDYPPSLFLIEGQKDRNSGLIVTKHLYVNE